MPRATLCSQSGAVRKLACEVFKPAETKLLEISKSMTEGRGWQLGCSVAIVGSWCPSQPLRQINDSTSICAESFDTGIPTLQSRPAELLEQISAVRNHPWRDYTVHDVVVAVVGHYWMSMDVPLNPPPPLFPAAKASLQQWCGLPV